MNYKDYLTEQLENPAIKAEYDAMESEFCFKNALISLQTSKKLSRTELSSKTTLSKKDISEIENGSWNPTLEMLEKLADSLDCNIKIEFVTKTLKDNIK